MKGFQSKPVTNAYMYICVSDMNINSCSSSHNQLLHHRQMFMEKVIKTSIDMHCTVQLCFNLKTGEKKEEKKPSINRTEFFKMLLKLSIEII